MSILQGMQTSKFTSYTEAEKLALNKHSHIKSTQRKLGKCSYQETLYHKRATIYIPVFAAIIMFN